ncbi:MAG: hypothetical protein HDQ88_12130 [Clostridia bacterium]|nr:hypothetical protein [Clostridia bacterium]
MIILFQYANCKGYCIHNCNNCKYLQFDRAVGKHYCHMAEDYFMDRAFEKECPFWEPWEHCTE